MGDYQIMKHYPNRIPIRTPPGSSTRFQHRSIGSQIPLTQPFTSTREMVGTLRGHSTVKKERLVVGADVIAITLKDIEKPRPTLLCLKSQKTGCYCENSY